MDNELDPVVDVLPGLVWSAQSDGRVEFLNRRWHEYAGRGLGEPFDVEWQSAIHPEDLPRWLECWRPVSAPFHPC